MNKLTDQEMTKIINDKTISDQTEEVRKQVMAFAFGEEFMASENKGEKQQADPLNDLTDEWESYCKAQSLECLSAEEMHLTQDLTADQKTYINDFIERWDDQARREIS